MPATTKLLEQILSEFALAIIRMADQPGAANDKALKEAVERAAKAIAGE